jgi:hypothetical protein
MPPSGRATKPTAAVLNPSRVPVSGSKFGKNSLVNTSGAAVVYRKKSYHSSEVPISPATMTRPRPPAGLRAGSLGDGEQGVLLWTAVDLMSSGRLCSMSALSRSDRGTADP